MIGTRVAGRYDIEDQIGIGGMGIVYRAYDTRLKRHVALKVIAPHLVQQESARSQFLREAQALAGLMHPNIVMVFDLCEEDATHAVFIVMELLRGQSLRHWMADPERPPFSQIALPLCRALEAAHAQGILHRDIKPENVFVCEDGTIKLMDFGLARLLTANTHSQASLVAGTLAYMAPEQLKGAKADTGADLYSLGILFYEYLTGVTPFEADNPGAILLKHLTESAPPLRNRVPDISPELEAVILRLLEKEPSARFDSATTLRETLERPIGEGELPLAYAADGTLPVPRLYSAPTVLADSSGEEATPILPEPTVVQVPHAKVVPQFATRRVKPALLMGGIACCGALALAVASPLHHFFAPRPISKSNSITKTDTPPPVPSTPLVQQANPMPDPSTIGAKLPDNQKDDANSKERSSAALDELIKQQEQTRTEVERLEKLVATSEAKRKAAELRATQAESAYSRGSRAGMDSVNLTPQQKARLSPLPTGAPDTLVQIASLHPHDQFDFRTKPVTRTSDGTIMVQVHNARACYVYFYLLQENRNQAVLLPSAERRLTSTPQRNVFTGIAFKVDDPSASAVKLLLLASIKPVAGLPASFTLPNVPKRSSEDVSIDQRFALLHDYRDQIVSLMQTNRVSLDGKNIQQDDLIVRFLRYKPTVAGTPFNVPTPQKSSGQNRPDVNGTRTPQIASNPLESFRSKDAL